MIREFTEHRFDRDIEGEGTLARADEALLRRAGARRGREPEARSTRPSSSAWPRAGGWSGWTPRCARSCGPAPTSWPTGRTCPTEVAIDEYVELAKCFFEGTEPGFVNGALDAVARDVRRLRTEIRRDRPAVPAR